jgi:hypothetical protein
MKRLISILVLSLSMSLILVGNASAAFDLSEVDVTFTNEDGSLAQLAGSHPFAMTTTLGVNTVTVPGGAVDPETNEPVDGEVPVELVKDFVIDQMPGFVGSQVAVPRCSSADFNTRSEGRPACPDSTAVGIAAVKAEFEVFPVGTNAFVHDPVYNLVPSPGEAAKLGFVVLNEPVVVDVGVSQKPPYNLVAKFDNVPEALLFYGSRLTLWGNPTSPKHDLLRGNCVGEIAVSTPEPVSLGSCPLPAGTPETAFLTLPRACTGPLQTSFVADSWGVPGAFTAPKSPPQPFTATGCGQLAFDPTIAATGTNPAAEAPSGLDFDLRVDDPGLNDPNGRAESDIERAIVTLPEGFTTNPSVANGLGACTLAQYEAEALRFDPSVGCPNSSKVGSVEVTSPLLEKPVDGQIYVAKQGDNVFHSLLALYMIIRDEEDGILIKQPMRVDPDPSTGRLTSVVRDIPQLPFSDFRLHFRGGDRAPLITPPTCGIYPVTAQLFPYADPTVPVIRTATLDVTAGPCAGSLGQVPHAPAFSAGTLSSNAGSYSPFVLKLARPDRSQHFSSITTKLPKGLLARLAGIPYCSEAHIAAATARDGEGEGTLELARPSCPSPSEVGSVTVGSGAGNEPLYVQGHAYLAGPYKGAPLSLEIITPAIAGPFDLGVVAVRTALQVDPLTSEVTAISDPIPSILHGLPLDVRSIVISMSRSQFTLNPTSCEPKSILGLVTSTGGATAALSQYFQASDCSALKFKPRLRLRLKGATRRIGHPALKAVVTYPKRGAYANIARAQVNLPHSEFLDQGNLNKTCTRPVLLEGKCPKSTIYGKAKAWSPLLDKPLQGPVYLVGGFGYKLPALIADLNGQIRVLLKGKVDSGKNKGIRSTFEAVPDAPVSRFVLEMKGGRKYGLLENSESLCKKPQRAIARFGAQNGRGMQWKPLIANDCGKKRHGKKHAKGKTSKK